MAEIYRIHIDPEIYHGKPCIRGTRIPVSLILEMLEYGSSISEILEEYPSLTEEDVKACLTYAKKLVDEVMLDSQCQDQVLT
jgi:uncharacterized protein (DUF433 family)